MTLPERDLPTTAKCLASIERALLHRVRLRKWLLYGVSALAAGATIVGIQKSSAPLPDSPPVIDLSNTAAPVGMLIESAREAVIRSPGSADQWGQLGVVLLAHELDAYAVPCLQQAVTLAPQNFRWTYYLGLAATAVDRSLAISSFTKACEIEPADSLAHARLGELLLTSGDVSGADRHLQHAIQYSRNTDPRPLQALARARLMEGRTVEAKELAEQARVLAPDSRMVLEVLAQVLDRLGEKEAVRAILHQIQSLPDQPLPWRDPYAQQALALRAGVSKTEEEAISSAERGDLNGAIHLLSGALERSPKDVSISLTLSQILLQSQRADDALRVLIAARSIAPGHAEICFRIGVVRFQQREYSRAVEAFDQALRVKPDYSMALYNMGHCYVKLNDPLLAIDAFRKTLRISPELDNARINLAKLLVQVNLAEQAREQLQKVLKRSPENAEATEMLKNIP